MSIRKTIWEGKQRVEVSLSDEQLERIISNFKHKTAYESFLKYVDAVKSDPGVYASIEGYEEELVKATDEIAGYGSILWYYAWEDLLKRHGLNVKWS